MTHGEGFVGLGSRSQRPLPQAAQSRPPCGSIQWGDGLEIETLINVRFVRTTPDGIRVLQSFLAERRRFRRKGRDAVVYGATVDESLVGEST